MLFLVVPILKPDLVLIPFTESQRKDYIDANGKWMKFVPSNLPECYEKVQQELFTHFMDLLSYFEQQRHFYLMYKSVEAYLQNLPWACSFLGEGERQLLGDHVNETTSAGAFPFIDSSRDHVHPGPESHRLMAESYWKCLGEQGHIEMLRKKIQQTQ